MTRSRHTLVLAAGVFLVTACATSEGGAGSAPATTSATTTTSTSAPQQVTTTTSATTATSTSAPQQATSTTTSVAPQNEPLLVGADPVIQLTPKEGAGLRPTLDWEGVEGAGSYFLVVKDDVGAAYWAWEGSETSIPLGGAEFPQDHGNGPTIGPGFTWSVSAYDVDGTFLAISGDRPVSP